MHEQPTLNLLQIIDIIDIFVINKFYEEHYIIMKLIKIIDLQTRGLHICRYAEKCQDHFRQNLTH